LRIGAADEARIERIGASPDRVTVKVGFGKEGSRKNKRADMKTRLTLVLALTVPLACAASDPAYHLLKTIPLAGDGGQDYLAIDQSARRLYVTHGTQVEVVDLDTEQPVGKIDGMNGVHGVALAPKLGHGFITSGITKTVKMFDLKTLQSLADIPVAADGPDGIVYEPMTDRVFAFEHKGAGLTVIDAKSGKVLREIPLPGQAEFPVVDGQGTVWDIIEDKSLVLKIDAKEMKILAQWPIGPTCEGPSGQAIDLANRRLFVGCNNEKMSVLDADTARILQTLPIGVHIDATAYDPSTGLIFNANRSSVTIIHQDMADQYSVVQNLETLQGTNTLALDLKTRKIYLSTNKFAPATTPGGRGTRVPGTFMVTVYGPK
jgi:DNA-binding beta-propeller fold protein YncE